MKFNVIGIEVGVLLSPDHEEFDFYSCVNPELPFGFYDENQYIVRKNLFAEERNSVLNYVQNGVDGTYGVISEQGEFKGDSSVDVSNEYDLFDYHQMEYGCFKNKNEILYSVAKFDGKLVEGFLEAELDKLAQKDLSGVITSASSRSEANVSGDGKEEPSKIQEGLDFTI